jgi:hypothetical protein
MVRTTVSTATGISSLVSRDISIDDTGYCEPDGKGIAEDDLWIRNSEHGKTSGNLRNRLLSGEPGQKPVPYLKRKKKNTDAVGAVLLHRSCRTGIGLPEIIFDKRIFKTVCVSDLLHHAARRITGTGPT